MINAWARPLPSGIEQNISDTSILTILLNFWQEYQAWIVLFFVVLGIGKIILNKVDQYQIRIKKLQKFFLFFLLKRQMMLPLIYTLAKRTQTLSPRSLQKILSIRQKLKENSLLTHTSNRMKIEKEVSHLLLKYFSEEEKKESFKKNREFIQVVQDLEFIDEKLVQLQQLYNINAKKWNQRLKYFPVNIFKKVFGFQSFQLFE